jgi:hypothetical protein
MKEANPMIQADRVLSTPPTNTSAPTPQSSRRGFLVQASAVAAAGAAIGAGLPLPEPLAATVQSSDAELIELGARFEPLLDQYYVAQERWSTSSAQDYRATADALHEIHDEMKPLANAINAASVTSIEGLRVKVLVTLWEIEPLCKGDTEFSFEDAYPFQQLFVAVAEVCGLNDKIAATGCTLPVIGLAWDDCDEDCADGEDA